MKKMNMSNIGSTKKLFLLIFIVIVGGLLFIGASVLSLKKNTTINMNHLSFPSGHLAGEEYSHTYKALKQFPTTIELTDGRSLDVPADILANKNGITVYKTFDNAYLCVVEKGIVEKLDMLSSIVGIMDGKHPEDDFKEEITEQGYLGHNACEYFAGFYDVEPKMYVVGYRTVTDDGFLYVVGITNSSMVSTADLQQMSFDCLSTLSVRKGKIKDTSKDDESLENGYSLDINNTILKMAMQHAPDYLIDTNPKYYLYEITNNYDELRLVFNYNTDADLSDSCLLTADGRLFEADKESNPLMGSIVFKVPDAIAGDYYITTRDIDVEGIFINEGEEGDYDNFINKDRAIGGEEDTLYDIDAAYYERLEELSEGENNVE